MRLPRWKNFFVILKNPTWIITDSDSIINTPDKIDKVKQIIKSDSPPDYCFSEVPEGKAGNMKLPKECTFCPYKFKCKADSNDGVGLRVFTYAKGLTYLTKVVKEPNVEEVLWEARKLNN